MEKPPTKIDLNKLLPTLQQAYSLREKKQFSQALEIAKACLRQFPYHPEVLCLMGILQLDLKSFKEAEKYFNSAISQQPTKADFYFLLGQTLNQQGLLQDAQNAYEQCVKIEKEHYHALLNLGMIYEKLGKYQAGINVLQDALKIKTNSAQAYHYLGIIHHKQNRLKEAIEQYEQALSHAPKDVAILSNLGNAYTKERQYAKALSCYKKALAISPHYVPALTNMGGTYIEMNQFLMGEKLMRQALELLPKSPPNWRNLTLCVSYHSLDHPDIQKVKNLLQDERLTPADKIHYYYALGKMHDDCQEYDQAFAYYDQANAVQAKEIHFNAMVFKRHVTRIIQAFKPEIFNKFSLPKTEGPVPIFIVGTPRSGKSLLEEVLIQSAGIQAAGEVGIAEFETKSQAEWFPKGTYPFWVASLTEKEALVIREAYLARVLQNISPKMKYVVDTLPGNFIYLGLLALLFPNAKFIHCTREPLDACLQMYFKYFINGHGYTYHLETLGAYYQQYQRIMNHWKKALPLSILEIKYEELVLYTEKTLVALHEFLAIDKLKFDPQKLLNKEVNHWRHYEKFLTPLVKALQSEIPDLSAHQDETQERLQDKLASAYQYYHQGDWQRAQILCEELLAQAPNSAPAWHLLGIIFHLNKKHEEAKSCLEKALAISPQVQFHLDLAQVLKSMGKQMEAEEHFKWVEKHIANQHDKPVMLTEDTKQELLSAFMLPAKIVEQNEVRILLQGNVAEDRTTGSYMTRSWDQYFTDLSFGSYRTIEVRGKHAWRMRAWHFAFKNIAVIEQILNLSRATTTKDSHPKAPIRVLDIGCATGYFRRFLEGNVHPNDRNKFYYWGLDIREDVLRSAVKDIDNIESGAKGNLVPSAFIAHDISHGLPYQDRFFDYIVNFEMIKYLPIQQGKKLLIEMHRVLKPKGLLYLSNTYSSNMPGFMQSVPYEQLEAMLQQNGFQILQRRGSQASFQQLAPHFKEAHKPMIKEMLAVHPPEMVAAMLTPLYPFCAGQVTFVCRVIT